MVQDSFLPSYLIPFLPFSLLCFWRQFCTECPLRKAWVSLVTLDSGSPGILFSSFGDTFGAFISIKCFLKLLVSCMAKAILLSLDWIDINPGSIKVVEINAQEGTMCFLYGDAKSANLWLLRWPLDGVCATYWRTITTVLDSLVEQDVFWSANQETWLSCDLGQVSSPLWAFFPSINRTREIWNYYGLWFLWVNITIC